MQNEHEMREVMRSPEAVLPGITESSTDAAAQDQEPRNHGLEKDHDIDGGPQSPETLVSDDEVDQHVAVCSKNYRSSKHEFGRWLREKKRRLVGRGRDGDWEPYLKAPERDIPLSTANDLIRRFEERESLRPIKTKVPESGTFATEPPHASVGESDNADVVPSAVSTKSGRKRRLGFVDENELDNQRQQIASAPVRVMLVYSRAERAVFDKYVVALFTPLRAAFPAVEDERRVLSLIVLEALRRAYNECSQGAA
jgi:hypothetical protein